MHERKRGLLARTNAFLRGVLLSCAVVVGGLLIAWLAVTSQVHDGIRREVERQFAERYREFRVTVRHARMYEGRGVAIHGLSVSRRGDNRQLAYVSEVFAECAVDAELLLSGQKPRAKHVHLAGLKLWAERQEDGTWDIERLWPLPEFGSSNVPVSVRDATVEVSDPRGGRRSFSFRNVCLEMTPSAAAVKIEAAGGTSSSTLFRGRAEGDYFEGIDFEGCIDAAQNAWSVSGRVDGLQWSAPLQAALPLAVQQRLSAAVAVHGRLDLTFSASNGKHAADSPRFLVNGALVSGQIQDRRLPFPLFDVRGRFELSNERIWLDQGFARNGTTTVTMQLEQRGWQADAPLTVAGAARQLELDRRFLEVLPPDLQDDWQKYYPAGTIDAEFRLEFDGRRHACRWKR